MYGKHPQSEINVVGIGTEKVLPDMFSISFAVYAQGKEPLDTEIKNRRKVNKILKLIQQYGIRESDIKVEEENLYQSATSITVTFYDLTDICEFYYNIQGLDINIKRVILSIQNVEQYYYSALQEAVKSCEEKAINIAIALETRNVPTQSIIRETSDIGTIQSNTIIQKSDNMANIELKVIEINATVEMQFLVEYENY